MFKYFIIATGCGSGLLPAIRVKIGRLKVKEMAGTYGSLFAIFPCVLVFSEILEIPSVALRVIIFWIVLIILHLFGLWSIPFAEKVLKGRKDYKGIPRDRDQNQIVIDEIAGMFVTYSFCIFDSFLPFNPWIIAVGFILFRVFDIIKLPPAKYFDKKENPTASDVMKDDYAAGIHAALSLVLLYHVYLFIF
ncbi:MAG TPA: phosphatidylglycerophosphatase A [bacterium]|jgi:phosphatidylglycerophosphatase A|nr:phosphatidylglycerophosphatase A [bacterium]